MPACVKYSSSAPCCWSFRRLQRQSVDTLGGLARDQPFLDIERDRLRIARLGIADTGAARSHDHQPLARRDQLRALALELLARRQADIARRAVDAAIVAARRIVDAV